MVEEHAEENPKADRMIWTEKEKAHMPWRPLFLEELKAKKMKKIASTGSLPQQGFARTESRSR